LNARGPRHSRRGPRVGQAAFASPEVPVRVEYDLSADGDRLRPVVETMREFGLWLKARHVTAD
jgi:hypothetical protein